MNIIDSFWIGNYIVAVDLYTGCSYCGSDIGIRLHCFTKKSAKFYGCLPSKQKTKPNEITDIFWFGMDYIKKGFLEYEDELKKYNNIEDFFDDYNYQILKKALSIWKTYEDTCKRGNKHK